MHELECCIMGCIFFFFKQKTAYEMRISDWSSDVCSSDLKASDALRVMELSTAITRLSTARNQVLNRMAAPFGLTAVQMMALHHVSVTPASTPSNLARNLAVDSASVTRLLDRLDNKGMIQRATQERVDRTQDRRVIEIEIG